MKSLLYHGFGIKVYRYRRTRYEKGEIVFELEPEGRPEAPQGVRTSRYRKPRRISLCYRLKPVALRVKVPRWLLHDDGKGIRAVPPFVKAYTKSRGNSGA